MKLTNKEGYNIKDTTYFQSFKSKQYSGHKKIPTAVAWNKQGTMLASAENVIKIWGHHGQYSL